MTLELFRMKISPNKHNQKQHRHLHAFNSTQKWTVQLEREKGFKFVAIWADKELHILIPKLRYGERTRLLVVKRRNWQSRWRRRQHTIDTRVLFQIHHMWHAIGSYQQKNKIDERSQRTLCYLETRKENVGWAN